MEITILSFILLLAFIILLVCRSLVIWYTGIGEVIKTLQNIERNTKE